MSPLVSSADLRDRMLLSKQCSYGPAIYPSSRNAGGGHLPGNLSWVFVHGENRVKRTFTLRTFRAPTLLGMTREAHYCLSYTSLVFSDSFPGAQLTLDSDFPSDDTLSTPFCSTVLLTV